MTPLRVAYIDLGISREQYSLQPTRYGGGAVVARYLKEDPDVDFHVFAPAEAFDNVGEGERRDRCVHVSSEALRLMLQGYFPLSAVFETMGYTPDLVLHPHTCMTINRGSYTGPICHFAGFDGKCGHPGNDYVLLYDPSFVPCFGERAKYVRIGKPVPATWPGYEGREPLVFQCTRHDDTMNSAALARQCLAEGFKGVFAGPIHNGYPLMEHIDGKTTVYLGEIGEADKLEWYRRASLFGLLHTWDDMPFSQSVIEAQGQGTPLYTRGVGPFLSTYLKHGVNGFEAGEQSLWVAHAVADADMSYASWKAATAYGVPVMTASFKTAFREIVAEWSDGRAG